MGKLIYLTYSELEYLRSLLEAQDPHDMIGKPDPAIAHYEDSRLSLSKKMRDATK